MDSTSFIQPELRKLSGSPLPKGRENAKNVLCRNVFIYGHCRYEEQGCAFNHDPKKTLSTQPPDPKKSLSFDSPAFTPANSSAQTPPKISSIKSHVANAVPFTPRDLNSSTTSSFQDSEIVPSFNPVGISEFTPASYDLPQPLTTNEVVVEPSFEPFSLGSMSQALPSAPFNPYLENATTMANTGAYFQAQSSFSAPTQPLQYHLYAPLAPHREDLLAYQRLTHEFFIPNNTREDLQRKSEATYQVIPSMFCILVIITADYQIPNFQTLIIIILWFPWILITMKVLPFLDTLAGFIRLFLRRMVILTCYVD